MAKILNVKKDLALDFSLEETERKILEAVFSSANQIKDPLSPVLSAINRLFITINNRSKGPEFPLQEGVHIPKVSAGGVLAALGGGGGAQARPPPAECRVPLPLPRAEKRPGG